MIAALWRSLPDGGFKNWAREKVHNHQQKGDAKYWREGEIYVLQTPAFTLKTAEPSYHVPALIDQFEEKHRIGKGETVIDAGAFGGILTNVFAKQVGPEGRVIAFEPDGLSRARVMHNLGLNGSPENVEVLAQGLWDGEREIEFCERGALGSSAFWDGPGGRKVTIETTTIDTIVSERNLPRLDFIKMNIEGAEIKALAGAAAAIAKFRPHFAICTDHFVDGDMAAGERTCGRVEAILKKYNYTAQTKIHDTEWVTYGTP